MPSEKTHTKDVRAAEQNAKRCFAKLRWLAETFGGRTQPTTILSCWKLHHVARFGRQKRQTLVASGRLTRQTAVSVSRQKRQTLVASGRQKRQTAVSVYRQKKY